MKSKRRTELMVGMFLLLGIILVTFLALKLGKFKSGMKDTWQVNVIFKNAAGIIKGSEVRLGGAKIGKVATTPVLTSNGGAVRLTLDVEEGVKIQRGSVVQAATLNLLGDKYIEIIPPDPPTNVYVGKNEDLFGDSGEDLETIKANVATISNQTIVLLNRVEAAMDDMQKAAKGYALLSDRINEGILSDTNIQNIEITLKNIAITAENLAKSTAEFPETLENVKEVTRNVRDTSEGIHNLVIKVDKKIDDLEPALNSVNPIVNNLKSSSVQLDKVLNSVNTGNGLLGALIYDKQLRADAHDFIRNLRSQGILRYKNPNAEEEVIDLRDRARMQGRRN